MAGWRRRATDRLLQAFDFGDFGAESGAPLAAGGVKAAASCVVGVAGLDDDEVVHADGDDKLRVADAAASAGAFFDGFESLAAGVHFG